MIEADRTDYNREKLDHNLIVSIASLVGMRLEWDSSIGWHVLGSGLHTCWSCRRFTGRNGCLSFGFRSGLIFDFTLWLKGP